MEDFALDERDEITHVRVAYSILHPDVTIKEENGREVFDGIMPAIVGAVTEWMNLSVTWIHEPQNQYGVWNGTHFTGMIGMLHRNEVDFIANPILPDNDVFRIADFLNPITFEAFTSLSGKETHEGGLFLYFSVLEPMVWACIGITLIIIAGASTLLFLRLSYGKVSSIVALGEYLWVYVANMLRQAPNEKWMMRHKKSLISALMPYLIMSWVIGVAFLVMGTFQSLLMSKLTIVKQYPVVDSLEEFVRKSSVTGLVPKEIELQLVLKGSGIQVYEETWEKLEPELASAETVFSLDSLQKVQSGKICIFHGDQVLISTLSDYFKSNGKCNFHLSKNMFFTFPLLMAVKKTLPKKFKDKINFGVTRLVDADVNGKWFKPIYEAAHFCTSYSENELKPLSLNNIFGVLMIWGVGMASAAISVIAEKLHFKYNNKKKSFSMKKKGILLKKH